MKLSIIIVHYKTLELTKRCLVSIKNSLNKEVEVIVVDNNSQDEIQKVIEQDFPTFKLIKKKQNEGFGRGCNEGLQIAKNKIVLLLNSDAILNRNVVERAISKMNESQSIGIVGCQIVNENGTPQNYTSTIASFKEELKSILIIDKVFPNIKSEHKAIMGSFMMIRKEAIEKCGMFDPEFFLYSEEIELCSRFLHNGYQIVKINNGHIIHKNNGSITNFEYAQKQSLLSKYLLFLKVKGYLGVFSLLFISLLKEFTNLIFMFFIDKNYIKSNIKNLKLKLSILPKIVIIPFIYSKVYDPKSKRILKLKRN
ncbi:MAG: glycosyltransferase family 2 protein [Lishizhenia sp.]